MIPRYRPLAIYSLLLVLDPPVAAAICAVASFLSPLLNRGYSQNSLTVA